MDKSKPGWTKPIIVAALLLTVVIGLTLYGPDWNNDALVSWARALPGGLFIAGFLLLPLVGVPGLPYASKLFLLALTNIPFKIYFGMGWPTYTLSSIIFVGLGEAAARLNWNWIIGLILLGALLAALSYGVNKKIRQELTSKSGSG